jgi:hypothetical protein
VERLYYARRPFGYDDELFLDRGQVVQLRGYAGDERLIRLGYLGEHLPSRNRPVQCGRCGAHFIDEAALNEHGNKRHRGDSVPHSPSAEDAMAEQELKRLNESNDSRLYLDKTMANVEPSRAKQRRGPRAGRPRVHV